MRDGDHDKLVRGDLTANGLYSVIDVPRSTGKGGGVAIIHKSSLKLKKQNVIKFTSFECMEALIHCGSHVTRLAVIYRPPSGSKFNKPMSHFINEFQQYIDNHLKMKSRKVNWF